ncbi:CDP-alcohol phosphatidyltransferase family protein [Thalassiella azotivora]
MPVRPSVRPRARSRTALGSGLRWRAPAPRCGHRGCWDGWREPLLTWPNLVTLVRTVVALALSAAAVSAGSQALLLAGLVVYWAGDVLDGLVARRLGQETRGGALLDVISDRACSVAFWVPWAVWHPELAWAVALYVLEFAVVDAVLSVAWLSWPLVSCNYVDRALPLVHRLNWWPPAKVVNTAGLVLLAVLWPQPVLAVVFVVAVGVVKVVSLVHLHAAAPGPRPGCAAAPAPEPRRLMKRDGASEL